MNTPVNLAFFTRGLFDAAYDQVALRLSKAGHDWNPRRTYWCPVGTATTTDLDDLDWHRMPFVGDYSRKYGKGFVASTAAKSMPDPEASDCSSTSMEGRDVRAFLVTARGGDIDLGCLRIRDFFAVAGNPPDQLIAVSGGRTTSALAELKWEEVEERADRIAPTARFRYLYDLNFRGVLLKVLRQGIRRFPQEAVPGATDRRELQLQQTVFNLEYLQVLYRLRDIGPIPYSPSVRPVIAIWQALLDAGWSWVKTAEHVENLKFALDHEDGVWFPSVAPVTTWTGTGSLPPLSEQPRSHNPSQVVRAITGCCVLGLITHDFETIRLSAFGHWLLELLPSKAKDADAPIRWHQIDHRKAARGDDWLRDHFRRIKRAVNGLQMVPP